MSIQDRLKMIIKANNMSASQFADEIGVQRSNLSHVLNGRNKPSLDFLQKVIVHFPKVNASWLITGEVREELEAVVEPAAGETKQILTKKDVAPDFNQEVDQIVFFLKDGTFRVFTPSNER